jgi:hypothetical protein
VPYKIKFTQPRLIKLHGKDELTIVNPTQVWHFLLF